jgi:NAD(P)-dependent dehydrogenase (short-subunit alcohol dehydrogenase family)
MKANRCLVDLRWDDEVVVVTGAGGGLGRAYALELARRGARVIVNDLGGTADGRESDQRAAVRVVEEIRAAGGEASANFNTVATPEGGKAIIDQAIATYGRIDAVIANAGILRDKSFIKLEWPDVKSVIDVNLMGVFHVAQPAYQAMKAAGTSGRLVLTTSASGLFGNFGQANYTAAKMGVVGLMRTLSIEGAKAGIRVNAVSPVAGTRLTGEAEVTANDDPMAPHRVAPIAVALTHKDCPVNGDIFLATGGWYARVFVGLTDGWIASADDLSVEGIAAHWDQISGTANWSEPRSAMDVGPMLEQRLYP